MPADSVEIGDRNMFGPDVYITDSNHQFGDGLSPAELADGPRNVVIGNRCWIGAKAVILKGVRARRRMRGGGRRSGDSLGRARRSGCRRAGPCRSVRAP